MTTNVSPENEQFIQQAIAEGRFVSRDEAINQAVLLLRDETHVNGHAARRCTESADDWIASLQDWATRHRRVESPVDYDRDSIYADHGE